MNRTEYVELLRKTTRVRRKRSALIILVPSVIALIVMVVTYKIVKNPNLFSIPTDAATYLLDTLFYQFSYSKLEVILQPTPNRSPLQSIYLLVIYWTFHAAGVCLIFYPPFALFAAKQRFIKQYPKYKKSLLDVAFLQDVIKNRIENRSGRASLTTIVKLRMSRPAYYASPVVFKWYKKPTYQWLSSGTIGKSAGSILYTLDRYEDALLKAIKFRHRLQEYYDSLTDLANFHFAVASRSDPLLRSSKVATNRRSESEYDLLQSFSQRARSLIITTCAIKESKRRIQFAVLRRMVAYPIFRNALYVSIITALVMTFGVFLFKIDSKQAFLTWFTVTFGSLTISVGVSSVALHKGRNAEHPDNRKE